MFLYSTYVHTKIDIVLSIYNQFSICYNNTGKIKIPTIKYNWGNIFEAKYDTTTVNSTTSMY